MTRELSTALAEAELSWGKEAAGLDIEARSNAYAHFIIGRSGEAADVTPDRVLELTAQFRHSLESAFVLAD